MTQTELFPESSVRLSKAEIIKYFSLMRDKLEAWTKLHPGCSFHEWLSDGVFDREERLKFAGVFFAREAFLNVLLTGKEILSLEISPGPNMGDVRWDLAHECEAVCPHRATL